MIKKNKKKQRHATPRLLHFISTPHSTRAGAEKTPNQNTLQIQISYMQKKQRPLVQMMVMKIKARSFADPIRKQTHAVNKRDKNNKSTNAPILVIARVDIHMYPIPIAIPAGTGPSMIHHLSTGTDVGAPGDSPSSAIAASGLLTSKPRGLISLSAVAELSLSASMASPPSSSFTANSRCLSTSDLRMRFLRPSDSLMSPSMLIPWWIIPPLR